MSHFGLNYSGRSSYMDRLNHLASSATDPGVADKWKRMSLRYGRIYGQDGSRLFEPVVSGQLAKDSEALRETSIDVNVEQMEVDSDEDDEARPLEPLSFRDFFGSSVDLTPSLLTIFDKYSNDEGTNNNNNGRQTLSRSTLNMTDTHCAETTEGSTKTELSNAKDCVTATNNELTVDNKKRPLSISSTSSSASSTSSLPRQNRRKKANTSQGSDGLQPSRASASDPHMDTLTDEELLADLPEEGSTGQEDDDISYSNRSSQSVGSSVELSDPKVRHMSRVVSEILQTERTYCNYLEEIIEGYLANVLEHSQDYKLAEDDISTLFCNVKEIHSFNRSFLAELEKCEEDAVQIAKCFVDHSQGFHIYTEYCTNYPRAVEVLTECMRKPDSAEAFHTRQKELGHALPLGSYLLKPVQRILKYHLLLQSLLKHYDKDRSGYDDIQGALLSMTDMAKHINEMKRKHEDAVRVQVLQSMLYDWTGQDLTTFGELILESSFRMFGAKASRQIFLFKRGLIIAKRKDDGTLACKAVVMCSNLMLIESIPKEPLCFHVIPFDNPRLQYTLQARSIQQKREWCQEIKRLILESYSANIPEKAKEIVLQQLGKDKESSEVESSESVDSGRVKNSAPVYLEKRKARRRSEFSLLKPFKATKKEGVSPRNSPPRRRKVSAIELGATQHVQEKQEKVRSTERHRSQSLTSLDDLALESLKTSKLTDVAETEKETGYDDASSRAKRMSQVLDEEGLEEQLSKEGWDQEVVSSVLQNTRVRRAESFKKAVDLHRLDSKVVKFNGGQSKLAVQNECAEVDTDSDSESYLARHGDYVELMVDNHQRVFPDEESLYSNIVVAQPQKVSPSQTKWSIYDELRPLQESGVITNRHAEELAKWQLSRSAQSRRHTRESLEHKKSVNELKKFFSDAEVKRPVLVNRFSDSNIVRHSTPRKCTEEPIYDTVYTGAVLGNPSVDEPIYDTVPLRTLEPVYDTVANCEHYDRVSVDRTRLHPDYTPKIGRLSSVDHVYDVPSNPWRAARSRSSDDGSYENVVFENRSALLESYSPPTSGEREKRNVIKRLATPPRTLLNDTTLSDSDTAEQRRTITRYATPPREVMTPDSMHLATVIHQSFNNSTVNLSDSSSYDNVQSPSQSMRSVESSPAHEPYLSSTRQRTKHGETSPSVRSTRDLWLEIERYIKMSPTGARVPKYPERARRQSSASESQEATTNSTRGRGVHKRSHSVDNTANRRSSSTDRFVDSLKKISHNITSKLSRKTSQPNSVTPADSQDSLTEERATTQTPINQIQKSVSKLARVYNRRVKAANKTLISRKSDGDLPMHGTDEERLNKMLLLSKPGSSAIGARIAEKQPPIVIGGYTLCRARPARPVPHVKPKSESDKAIDSTLLDALADLSSSDSEDEGTVVAGSKTDLSLQDGKNSTSNSDNYYETKLSSALEDSDLFRDSAVYSDADSPENVTASSSESEQRPSRSRPKKQVIHDHEVQRSLSAGAVEMRHKLPGRGIQDRLRHLEKSCSYVKPEQKIELKEGIRDRLKQLENSTKVSHKTDALVSFMCDAHLPSIKDRQSMLVEDSLRERSSSLPPEDLLSLMNDEEEATLHKGYVKNVAQKFQHET